MASTDLVEQIWQDLQAVQRRLAHLESLDRPSSDHGDLDGLGDDDHTQYLLVNGTRAMTGDLTLPGNPDADLEAATKQYVDANSFPPWLPAHTFQDCQGTPARGNLGSDTDDYTPTWRLDASSPEAVNGCWCAPATGNLTVKWYYAMESATSGDVRLDLNYKATGDGENAAAAGSTASQTASVPGTAKYLDIVTMLTNLAVTAGDLLRLTCERDATHGDDDASGDLHFIGLLITYT